MIRLSIGHSFAFKGTLFNITPLDISKDIFGCPLEDDGFIMAVGGRMEKDDVVRLRNYLNELLKESENAESTRENVRQA